MGSGFQFFDIILFALIAAFLVLRLRGVLGRRDGHEGGYHDPFRNMDASDAPENPESDDNNIVRLPGHDDSSVDDLFDESPAPTEDESIDRIANGLHLIKRADSRFNIDDFRNGARSAFEMIVGAFIAGDSSVLKPLLSPEVYGNFADAIREREQAGEKCEDSLIGIKKTEIVEAYMEGRTACVTIKFVSDQVKATLDENGDVVDGDPNVIIEVTDFWTFARDTRSKDPNWALVATRSLE